MKITIVSPVPSYSGGYRVIAIYAQLLQNRGHEVYCVAPPQGPVSLRAQLRSIRKGTGLINRPKYPLSHFDEMGVPLHFLDRHRPVTDKDVPDADVVVATWWETMEWVEKLSPSKGRKCYFIQHYEVFEYTPQERVIATYRMSCTKITVAQWIADRLASQHGTGPLTVVPNAVDSREFYAPARQRQPVPTLGVMYSPVAWKGCATSLKAFELASQRVPGLKLVAFSRDKVSTDLPLPAGSEFHYCPTPEKIRECYSQCDGWLFGSTNEGFGLPILEAMACRTPVIGTPSGAAPELLGDGSGVLLKSFEPEEMAEAIVGLFQMSPAGWGALSEKAYQKAVGYTWDDAVVRFEAALKGALG